MSSRKPKAVIVRGEDLDEDIEATSRTAGSLPNISRGKPKPRKKINVFADSATRNNASDEELLNISVNVTKTKKAKKTTLNIPLLIDEDSGNSETVFSIDKFAKNSIASKGKDPVAETVQTATPREAEQREEPVISRLSEYNQTGNLQFEADKEELEYVPLDSNEGDIKMEDYDEQEDYGFHNDDLEMLDDGRLPLTGKEANVQKRLHEMSIGDAIYEAEISPDEQMDDWEASKMKHGKLNVHSASNPAPLTIPKFRHSQDVTVLNETQRLEEVIQGLTLEKKKLEEKLTSSATRRQKIRDSINELKRKAQQSKVDF